MVQLTASTISVYLLLLLAGTRTDGAKLKILRYFSIEETGKEASQSASAMENDKRSENVVQTLLGSIIKQSSADMNTDQVLKDGEVLLEEMPTPLKDADVYETQWRQFRQDYNKEYESAAEEQRRFVIFKIALKEIEEHNQQYRDGLSTYTMGINQFSDWTAEEFANYLPVLDPNRTRDWMEESMQAYRPENWTMASGVDWRTKGYVTPVKNQGSCGSCWAFSTTGSLEGQWYEKTSRLVSLSEQQLVDCSRGYGNRGCQGGLMVPSFIYIKDNGGIESERDYPYETRDGNCRFVRAKVAAKVTGYRTVTTGSESALQNAVYQVGPVSVAIWASRNFQGYNGGVFVDNTCNNGQINHAVLVVGYGSSGTQDYWIVKNSWGTSWGEGGYIKMARNRGNMCSIASLASFPLV